MNPLFYVASALSLAVLAVMVHALLSAPEGYEDENGFHTLHRRASRKPPRRPAVRDSDPGVHPHLSPR